VLLAKTRDDVWNDECSNKEVTRAAVTELCVFDHLKAFENEHLQFGGGNFPIFVSSGGVSLIFQDSSDFPLFTPKVKSMRSISAMHNAYNRLHRSYMII
jgi:hypothetical protein